MTAARQTRGFLFADLRGYSEFTEQHGDDAARDLLRRYRTLVRGIIARHAGAEIRTEGDSFYVVFSSLGEAVIAGLEILEEADAATASDSDRRIALGIGIHAGETLDGEDGIVSSAVNIAARVCAAARPGQLLVTETVRALTRGYLPADFAPVGKRRLKGIRDAMALFEVRRGAVAGSRAPRIPHAVAAGGAFAAAVIVVAVAAAMAIDGWLTTAGHGSGVSPPPSAGVTPSAVGALPSSGSLTDPDAPFPTAVEERLLGLLDERDRESCGRADAADGPIFTTAVSGPGPGVITTQRFPVPYVAAIDCDLGGISAPDRLLYWDILRQGFGRFINTADPRAIVLQQAGRLDAPPRSCDDGAPALEAWSFGGASGDLVCWETTTGDAIIMWSVDDSLVLGRAIRDDRDMPALLDWWREVARFRG